MLARYLLAAICLSLAALSPVLGQNLPDTIRIATYNIEHFGGKPNGPNRISRLKTVVAKLNADVIGLQEIKDRQALRSIFPANEWQILIDDNSGDSQDLAIAARLPYTINGSAANDIDAKDGDFLFPADSQANDKAFPNNRDVLFARIGHPSTNKTFVLMVHHAKARAGGRSNTDARRELAAELIVSKIESDFDNEHVVLLGDMNDNPDDVSINILETGDDQAAAGPDDVSDDAFLVNLTQPLAALDQVSWGLNETRIVNGKLDTRVSGSRSTNNNTRGGPGVISPILFDQILVSRSVFERFTVKSVMVLDEKACQEGHIPGPGGNAIDYASDHTPVVVEFASAAPVGAPTIPVTPATPGSPVITPPPAPGTVAPVSRVRIAELLPDPNGPDQGKETVTLRNFGSADTDLTGWRLTDKAGNEVTLTGVAKAGGIPLVIELGSGELPLNNGGDEVRLFDDQDVLIDRVRYTGSEVTAGTAIRFTN